MAGQRFSKIVTFTAEVDIAEYSAVVPGTADGKVKLPGGDNEKALGFAHNSAEAGEPISVVLPGSEVEVKAAGAFGFGADLKTSGATGVVAETVTAGDNVVAIALQEATAADEIIRALAVRTIL